MEHKRGENGAAGKRRLRRPLHKRSTRSKAGRGEEDEGGNTCPSGGIIWVIVISIVLVATLSVFNILALSDKPGGAPHQHSLGFLAAATREPDIPWRGKLPPVSPTDGSAPAAGAQGQLPPAGVAATSAQVQQAPMAGHPAGRGATVCFEGDTLMHVTTDADAEEVTFGAWIYLPQVPEASFPASSGSMKTIASTKVSGCELKDGLTDGWSFWVHEWGTTNRQLRLSWTSGADACHELFSRTDLVPFDKWVLVGFTLSKAQNRAQIFLEGHLIADTTQSKGEFATAGKPLPLERADIASRVIRARGGKADLYLGAHPAQHKDYTGQSSHAFIGFLGDVRLLHTAVIRGTALLLAMKPEELLSSGMVAPSAVVLQIQFELGQGPRNSVDSGSLAARKVISRDDDPSAIHLTAFAEHLRHPLLGVVEAPAPPVEIPLAPPGSTLDPDALRATWPEEWTKAFSSEVLLQSQREADPWADEVRDAMRHTWAGYRQQAWGHDEVKPVSGRPNDWCKLAITMLDGLSTLWVMGLHKEFDDAERWLQENPLPSEGKHGMHSLFEINIRAVGGLLSAHSLSGRGTFLEAARKLVDRILPAFNTPHGMPHGAVDVGTGEFGQHPWQKGKNVKTILAEPTTVQLEYRYLSHVTGDAKYAGVADRAENAVLGAAGSRGVVPIYLASVTQGGNAPTFVGNKLSFGGMGDSYYEYLLKQWVQTGRKEHRFKDAWKNSIRGMMEQLVMKTNGGLTFVGEKDGTRQKAKMDHLTCFVAGMLMLGSRTLPKDEVNPEWEPLAAELAQTCYEMYRRSPTGLAPEYVDFKQNQGEGQDMSIPHNAAYNILRPEAIEALYYMHYYTGDPKYRRWAREMFSAFQKHCRAQFGYSALADVRKGTPSKRDSQESFWLAETLKYFYLIFSPRSTLSLEEFVLNTEAHPLKIWS